ncbi:hypothetical protein O4J56_29070 [Nocardiopsis sp. RSe5-2]|uniref:Asp23/Gls24 family envelope stress response protein n=1 Tax=Nocardiopsis endophytica TaxID=3018445 RepID=A0ABT4UDB7_9ACTN|nr:hypothetical protein [Nocardiopsis endophytica]MDA2814731.1 hypothetical protein [Nocardiopsis endophytica]
MAVNGPGPDGPDGGDRLPCGTSLDALLDHLREGRPTAHERACPHCTAAAEELRVLTAARDEAVADLPAAPPGLADRVMRTVRAEGRSSGYIALPGPPGPAGERGWTRIRTAAVAALFRAACDTVPGAAVGHCRFSEGPDGIAVELSARFTGEVPAPRLAEELRGAVRAAALHHLGWRLARVDVRFH